MMEPSNDERPLLKAGARRAFSDTSHDDSPLTLAERQGESSEGNDKISLCTACKRIRNRPKCS